MNATATAKYPRGYAYSREHNPNRAALKQCAAAVEGGREALALASSMAVVTTVIQGLEPGDHVLAPDNVYDGFRKVPGQVFAKWPVEVTYVAT